MRNDNTNEQMTADTTKTSDNQSSNKRAWYWYTSCTNGTIINVPCATISPSPLIPPPYLMCYRHMMLLLLIIIINSSSSSRENTPICVVFDDASIAAVGWHDSDRERWMLAASAMKWNPFYMTYYNTHDMSPVQVEHEQPHHRLIITILGWISSDVLYSRVHQGCWRVSQSVYQLSYHIVYRDRLPISYVAWCANLGDTYDDDAARGWHDDGWSCSNGSQPWRHSHVMYSMGNDSLIAYLMRWGPRMYKSS